MVAQRSSGLMATSLEVFGKEITVPQTRFMTAPNVTALGTFDVACFVPGSAMTKMDPESIPAPWSPTSR
jgi:hypothetical protein